MMVSPATPNPIELSEAEERALVARLKQDDDAAFEEVVRRFGPRMLSVARRMLTQEQDAQDAVQDAFLSAFKAIDNFQGDAKLGTWLHRIVVNAGLMKLRSKRRRPEAAIDDLLPKYHDDGHRRGNGDWRVTHDTAVQTSEIREQVLAAIDKLPDLYRDILMLRDIEELSTEEAAKQLEITEGAVKTRLHRARLALRESLDPFMRGEAI
jgi:RNA polymerase sigma-70 factor (ECF subfamily)